MLEGTAQTKIPSILAGTTLVLCMLFCCISTTQQPEISYMVGDDKGWTFGVSGWPDGKSFKAGDILVFMYDRSKHDVVVVRDDQHGYDSCTVPQVVAGWYQTGYDEIKLEQGTTFFISSYPQTCASGMKLAINVTASSGTSST